IELLAYALARLLCGVVMLAGAGIFIYAIVKYPIDSSEFANWTAGAFGCIVGGGCGLLWVWGIYRQLKGFANPMQEPNWYWLATVFVVLLVLGIVAFLSGLNLFVSRTPPAADGLKSWGAVVAFIAAIGVISRARMRRKARLKLAPEADGPSTSPRQFEES